MDYTRKGKTMLLQTIQNMQLLAQTDEDIEMITRIVRAVFEKYPPTEAKRVICWMSPHLQLNHVPLRLN